MLFIELLDNDNRSSCMSRKLYSGIDIMRLDAIFSVLRLCTRDKAFTGITVIKLLPSIKFLIDGTELKASPSMKLNKLDPRSKYVRLEMFLNELACSTSILFPSKYSVSNW